MMDIGAKRFLLKSSGFNELENANKSVMKGVCYFSSKLQKEVDNSIYRIDIKDNTENEGNQRNGKMLFFPWIVKMKNV